MPARVATVAFRGIETLEVDVQVHVGGGGGWPGIYVVGLPDKAVGESRERVHAALTALGLAVPSNRIIVTLPPPDRPPADRLPLVLGKRVSLLVDLVVPPFLQPHFF